MFNHVAQGGRCSCLWYFVELRHSCLPVEPRARTDDDYLVSWQIVERVLAPYEKQLAQLEAMERKPLEQAYALIKPLISSKDGTAMRAADPCITELRKHIAAAERAPLRYMLTVPAENWDGDPDKSPPPDVQLLQALLEASKQVSACLLLQ
jgi:hypothetical protein